MTYYNQWILHNQLLMGSSIPSKEKYRKLVDEKGVTHILDLEKFCDLKFHDPIQTSPKVLHMYHPDDGKTRPDWFWRAGFEFARTAILGGGVVYVHCKYGNSRGPSMTYGILKYFEALPDEKVSEVQEFGRETIEKVFPGNRESIYQPQIEAFIEEEVLD